MSATLPGSSKPVMATKAGPNGKIRGSWSKIRKQSHGQYVYIGVLGSLDAIFTAASSYLAFCMRIGQFPLSNHWTQLYLSVLLPCILFRFSTLALFRVYRIAARHTSGRDVLVIAAATAASTVLIAAYIRLMSFGDFPKSVVYISSITNFLFVAGSRAVYRMFMDARQGAGAATLSRARRTLIVGAGVNGASLARELKRQAAGDYQIVGFLDDDPAKRRQLINGVPVLGGIMDMRRVVMDEAVDTVIVAIAHAGGLLIRQITGLCEGLNVRLRICRGFSIVNDVRHLHTVRDVSVEDLLCRQPVSVDSDAIASYLRGERVLITGAGGSIGSELVRQILSSRPAEIFLLGHGENSLFEIEQELRREHNVTATCLVADIRDYDRLLRLFERHRPSVVFHAAAHKHVPMMEANVEEAVTNNVLGTHNLARIASRTGVKRFVMISTDKAVNPTSVMGAAKRIAEMVVQAESRRSDTEFACVRFGNVLGSRGSVVPTMRKQIERGGPVTVTHAEITRYFMTIPEAVQLVIQAGAMGGSGTIYMLDMGEPVKIVDLARDLIRLSGLVPDRDIPIEITGLRPGEKLYEELLTAEEGASVTRHERIYAARPALLDMERLDGRVGDLIAAAKSGDSAEVYRLLKALAPTYQGLDDRIVVTA
jgi:FlaA1/EpsC-like NDP-sugar epimerase